MVSEIFCPPAKPVISPKNKTDKNFIHFIF
jgi:hypothetical protein